MGLANAALAVTAERNAVSAESLGIVVGGSKSEDRIISTVWTVLEAANDLDDVSTVEACQRVIDANLSGSLPR